MVIRAVVFDLDGLLLDTEVLQRRGWVEALKPLGIRLTNRKYLDYTGNSGAYIEKQIVRDLGLQIEPGSLLDAKEEWLMNYFRTQPIPLMPYAEEAVNYFIKKGLKVGAASGSRKDEMLLKLEKTGLADKFHSIVAGSEVARSKPFPDIYVFAARQLKTAPSKCLAFEDTEFGIRSAKGAGMACIAVPTELSAKQDLSMAEGIFRNLKEAVGFAKRKYGL